MARKKTRLIGTLSLLVLLLLVPNALALPIRKIPQTFPDWRQEGKEAYPTEIRRDSAEESRFIDEAVARERQTTVSVIRVANELPLLVRIIDIVTDGKEINREDGSLLSMLLQKYGFGGPRIIRIIAMQKRTRQDSSLLHSRIVGVLEKQKNMVQEHIRALFQVHVFIYFVHRLAPNGDSGKVVKLNEERIRRSTNLYRQLRAYLNWYRRIYPR